MSRNTKQPIQFYRGTTAQHSGYTGPVGECTVDATKNTLVVHEFYIIYRNNNCYFIVLIH